MQFGMAVGTHEGALRHLIHHGVHRSVRQSAHIKRELLPRRIGVMKGKGGQVSSVSAMGALPSHATDQLKFAGKTTVLLPHVALMVLALATTRAEPSLPACEPDRAHGAHTMR